jgi:excisionase family DNA binding protein
MTMTLEARPDELLTVPELCEYLKVARSTVYNWRAEKGKGPTGYRVGGSLRYRRSVVDTWLESEAV